MPKKLTLEVAHFEITLEGHPYTVFKVESTYYPEIHEELEIFDTWGNKIERVNPLYDVIQEEYYASINTTR